MKRLTVLAVAAVTAVALAACGTTEDPSESRSDSGGDPITVTDARGKEVTLDGPAVNVAATEWNAVEYLVSLGVQPVGVSDIKGFETWDSAVELADTATDIGTRGEPNMDILVTLDLDAVFVTGQIIEGAVEQIEQTIPVIVLPGGDSSDPIGSMWANIDLIAQATGTESAAENLKTEFQTTLTDAAAAIADTDAAGASVAFNDAYDAGEGISIRPFTSGSLIGAVLAELGFANAWDDIGIEGDAVYGLGQTDVEGLTKLPDEALYWYIGNDSEGDDVYSDSLADNPIWTSLPFVSAGNVVRLPDSIWMFGGPASMTQFVAAVVKATG